MPFKIEIAGGPASGKTTLADRMFYNIQYVRIEHEDISENPFIRPEYNKLTETNAVERAFATQVSFVLSKTMQHLLAETHTDNSVFDYCLAHESGYQKFWFEELDGNLALASKKLLKTNFDTITYNVRQPDVIIKLNNDAEQQRANIVERYSNDQNNDREFELDLWTVDNLERLNNHLEEAFELNRDDTVPVVEFDAMEGDFNHLIKQLQGHLMPK